jgi:hypothetical protein
MTATVKFETASAENALVVPAGALRLAATNEMKAEAGLDTTGTRTGQFRRGDSTARRDTTARRQLAPAGARPGLLWTTDSTGKVKAIRVRVGVTDGQRTVIEGPNVHEGMSIIIGLGGAANAAQQAGGSTNPLTPQRPGGRGF